MIFKFIFVTFFHFNFVIFLTSDLSLFQLSTAKNEINLFNNPILIVAPVTFAPACATTPSAEFWLHIYF